MAPSSTSDQAYSELLGQCTIRARVAFVLCIAEAETGVIDAGRAAAQVRSALDLAWQWELTQDVSGDALYAALENENEDGLMNYEWTAPDAQKPAWVAITSAIAYTSWHAFGGAGAKHTPEPINEVTEEVIDQVVANARRAPGFSQQFLDGLVRHCLENYRARDPSSLGEPIRREVIWQAANSA